MFAPPTGTVTFLFTDVEGSTAHAQAQPDGWEAARRRHHAILRAAIYAHQGRVFQVVGDAFCAAFHNAADGLAAALAAQRALRAERWPQAPVRVRMGLHTGAAEFLEGEYRGYLTLAHVQRVMAAAHGGQVLISNASAALLGRQLPAGASLRDLGEQHLKGLLTRERLWQLVAPDLPDDFPPLRTRQAAPHNLPVQLTSFVGRDQEIAEVSRLLAPDEPSAASQHEGPGAAGPQAAGGRGNTGGCKGELAARFHLAVLTVRTIVSLMRGFVNGKFYC